MKLIKNIDNKVFIFENVLDESIIDSLLIHNQANIKRNNYVARFGLVDDIDPTNNISFNKSVIDLTDEEKYIWDNFKNIDTKRINKKDIEIPVTDYSLLYSITNPIKDYLRSIYGDYITEYYNQTTSVLTYYPGNLMNVHSDATPTNPRICTTTLYLNEMKDEYEGGEIIFYDNTPKFENPEKLKNSIIYIHKPQRNQLIVFDSYFNKEGIYHSVSEIKNWNRDVFRTYWQETSK